MSLALTTSVFNIPFAIYKVNTPTATVIDANPTATTLDLLCPAQINSEGCPNSGYNNTIVIGPWASRTVPEGAPSTGTFHWMVTWDGWGPSSVECSVSSGIPLACTALAIASANGTFSAESLKQVATGMEDITKELDLTFSTLPIVITAGQDLLKLATQATATKDSTNSGKTGATSTSNQGVSETGSSTDAAVPTEINGVVSSATRVFGVMFIAGLASLIIQG
ncbi:hypothetical protein FHETE_7057 [Fusarium heterosporum]|uniref:Uncharacterized protein n=1 Tax=Fusarium heterosporum TaxID=42747 RepID=A0A8H5T4G5_FUSHE|nr:hypothetical protein FHETE_7057 [Fusarium heterosporum]